MCPRRCSPAPTRSSSDRGARSGEPVLRSASGGRQLVLLRLAHQERWAMRRREFITMLGGAAVAWPVATQAQQNDRVRRIGVLTNLAADDPEGQVRNTAFAQALAQLGWTVGQNLRIEHRWGAGDAERIRRQAAELVALTPEVILDTGAAGVAPVLEATRKGAGVFGL